MKTEGPVHHHHQEIMSSMKVSDVWEITATLITIELLLVFPPPLPRLLLPPLLPAIGCISALFVKVTRCCTKCRGKCTFTFTELVYKFLLLCFCIIFFLRMWRKLAHDKNHEQTLKVVTKWPERQPNKVGVTITILWPQSQRNSGLNWNGVSEQKGPETEWFLFVQSSYNNYSLAIIASFLLGRVFIYLFKK